MKTKTLPSNALLESDEHRAGQLIPEIHASETRLAYARVNTPPKHVRRRPEGQFSLCEVFRNTHW